MRRRGPGYIQRRILEALADSEDHELYVLDLRRRLDDPDRSNLRRSVRALIRRGSIEEAEIEGGRAVRITMFGLLAATLEDASEEPDPLTEMRERWREEERELEERRKRRAKEEELWAPPSYDFERRSYPGPTQRRVIAALRDYPGHPERGLPKAELKAAVESDRANTRRAVRSLLARGVIQQTHEGERLRLPPGSIYRHLFLGGEDVVAYPGTPMKGAQSPELRRKRQHPAR